MIDRSKQTRAALILFIVTAVLLGSYLRIAYVSVGDYPVNDGGLFWTMTQDLIANHFVLPLYTSYNLDHIPFAYPPGAFYLLGFLNQAFKIGLLPLFRFFPLLCNILVLFLIYPITRRILRSRRQALFALFIYAIILPSYDWLIMGGGVTRAPGQLFALLAVLATLMYVTTWRKSWLFLSVPAITLAGYFHLETAWRTAILMIFLFLLFDRSKKVLAFALVHAAAGAVLLAPYWLTVLHNHGVGPFINAFQSGNTAAMTTLGLLIVPIFTAEPFFPLLAVLGLLGLFTCLAARQYKPLLWLLFVILVDPRSLHRSAAIPEAMITAIALDVLVLQGLAHVIAQRAAPPAGEKSGAPGKGWRIPTGWTGSLPLAAALFLLAYAYFMTIAFYPSLRINHTISTSVREGFAWVQHNTPADASVLVFPASDSWERDWIAEWFPTLSGRHNVLTVQGNEWLPKQFDKKEKTYLDLVDCLKSEIPCYQAWEKANGISYDYFLFPRQSELFTQHLVNPSVLAAQKILSGCDLVYQNTDLDIYHCASTTSDTPGGWARVR